MMRGTTAQHSVIPQWACAGAWTSMVWRWPIHAHVENPTVVSLFVSQLKIIWRCYITTVSVPNLSYNDYQIDIDGIMTVPV
jgi:hypothetical protein